MAEETKNVVKVERGDSLFQKGQKVTKIALILKGSIMMSNDYMSIPLQTGEIIGLLDMRAEEYLYDYIALDTSTVCTFECSSIDELSVIGTAIKDYRNYIMRSMLNQLDTVMDVYETLDGVTHKLYEYIKEYYNKYKKLCNDYIKKPVLSQEIESLKLYDDTLRFDERTIRYFESLSDMPDEIVKPFFAEDDDITGYHIYMASQFAEDMAKACSVRFGFYREVFPLLFDKGGLNLFAMYSKLAMDVAGAKGDTSDIMDDLDKIIALIRECKDMKEETLGLEFSFDFARINDICKAIKMKSSSDNVPSENEENKNDDKLLFTYSDIQINEAVEDSKGSLKKILDYSGISSEKADIFEKYLTVYRGLKDPFSTENDVRKLRSRITELYYEIYENVFFKTEEQGECSRVIEMFLDFGYMDERMFDKNTLVALYYTKQEQYNDKISVYTIRQWLHAIYKGEKEPSKNEFDLDYEENFRELKRTQKFTAEEESRYFSDTKAKVRYEIVNMFKTNNRLTNGQITTFCPVLSGRDFMTDVQKMYITPKKAADAILEITDIDFSAFYREYLFEDMENKISKINLYKEVFPDIILMPNAGHKGSMWQEISGKKRDTPGRFVIPAFTAENFQDIVIRLIGAFRWELCRTIQGTYWNDIREKSLTAEYCDYIQFYKKNRELSDEVKQKIKVQMQKCRNNTKEMFIKDYELWIKNESLGLARVNKIVRMILFAYCPFSKKYRTKIAEHPMFKDGAAKYERERLKKVKELNNRFAAIRNAGGQITPLLEQNMEYLTEQ